MTTKHTPGPWRIVDREIMEDGSVYPCHILGGAADYQVCTLESPQIAKLGAEQPHRFPGLNGVLGPNANLIAAAPEIFKALDDLFTDMLIAQGNMRDAAKHDHRWEGCAEEIQPRIDAARAALAKAKGQAQ
ncbi:hypothetical protein CEY09_31635 [Achromobacter marplatensis]|uniref:Phage protein n=1 Tax=Achromobacter marplatensis TaxID=470868 RepID=A0ABX9FTY4_9BURK|nr:hypothetical protein [Achromobacter marplatensis]OWT54003.1 hypothetical protein CEY09_31635 [Achromobacter marplatensis]RBP09773.1 hypothetical protein DFP87_1332 [Achromobacter marplatensis]CAB3717198.1 hypothetical protein LMG26219_06311 [Achromobacter marplatensis]